MEEQPQPTELSAGAIANKEFVESMREKHPEVPDLIRGGCKDCSTAWLLASKGRRLDDLLNCPGRTEMSIGELCITVCSIP